MAEVSSIETTRNGNSAHPAPANPKTFSITAEQLSFVIRWVEAVPLPRTQTNEVVAVLSKVTNQPIG